MKHTNILDIIQPESKVLISNVIDLLNSKGLIEKVDDATLLMLAYNYSTFLEASRIIKEEGLTITSDRGNIAEHPAVKIARDAQVLILKVMTELGLTVKSRNKISGNNEKEEETPFENFIKQSKV